MQRAAVGETRQRLMDTARTLFAEQGFHAVSLRRLGRDLGLHAGSLYAHVESKEALLHELIEESLERRLERARRALREAQGVAPLATLIRLHLSFEAEQPACSRLLRYEFRHLSSTSWHIAALQRAYLDLFARELGDHEHAAHAVSMLDAVAASGAFEAPAGLLSALCGVADAPASPSRSANRHAVQCHEK
jgi:AcrR family transcriptional regulator